MKPRYDELSLPISITITDRERIFRWGRTHRSHERFTRPKWDPSLRYPSSAECTTATNDGLPERARIKPCRYWLSDFLVRRVLAHRCTSQRIGFTRFNEGPQAHRPLRVIWKNTFDPWAAPNFREAQWAKTGFPARWASATMALANSKGMIKMLSRSTEPVKILIPSVPSWICLRTRSAACALDSTSGMLMWLASRNPFT